MVLHFLTCIILVQEIVTHVTWLVDRGGGSLFGETPFGCLCSGTVLSPLTLDKTIFYVCGLIWILLLSECRSHTLCGTTDLRFQLYDSSLGRLTLSSCWEPGWVEGHSDSCLWMTAKSWLQPQVLIKCQTCGLINTSLYSPSLVLLRAT